MVVPAQGAEKGRHDAAPVGLGGAKRVLGRSAFRVNGIGGGRPERKIGQNLGFPYFLGVILAQPHFKTVSSHERDFYVDFSAQKNMEIKYL